MSYEVWGSFFCLFSRVLIGLFYAKIIVFLLVFAHLCTSLHIKPCKKPCKNLICIYMAKLKWYLDVRGVKNDEAPIKLRIGQKDGYSLINVGIRVRSDQWNEELSCVVGHPQRAAMNRLLAKMMLDANSVVDKLHEQYRLGGMSAREIKVCIEEVLHPEKASAREALNLFAVRFRKSMESKKAENTRSIYRQTYGRMLAYDKDLERLRFEDVTRDWLMGFDAFMAKTSPSQNARNIHLRNIRAVFNEAIDDEITNAYPFRRFKIKPVATVKRSLTVEQLRLLFSMSHEEHLVKYVDMFKLMFYLIGINTIDLCHLKEVRDGRVEYHRAKTSRLYSIKVEPEAMALIEKYRGQKFLLDPLDHYENYRVYTHRLNNMLKRIGEYDLTEHRKKVYKSPFPQLTTYWARHTWATIAAELDIPKETIAAALGHGGNTVTDIYINFDMKKVDEANRCVMDYVLYDKR